MLQYINSNVLFLLLLLFNFYGCLHKYPPHGILNLHIITYMHHKLLSKFIFLHIYKYLDRHVVEANELPIIHK